MFLIVIALLLALCEFSVVVLGIRELLGQRSKLYFRRSPYGLNIPYGYAPANKLKITALTSLSLAAFAVGVWAGLHIFMAITSVFVLTGVVFGMTSGLHKKIWLGYPGTSMYAGASMGLVLWMHQQLAAMAIQ